MTIIEREEEQYGQLTFCSTKIQTDRGGYGISLSEKKYSTEKNIERTENVILNTREDLLALHNRFNKPYTFGDIVINVPQTVAVRQTTSKETFAVLNDKFMTIPTFHPLTGTMTYSSSRVGAYVSAPADKIATIEIVIDPPVQEMILVDDQNRVVRTQVTTAECVDNSAATTTENNEYDKWMLVPTGDTANSYIGNPAKVAALKQRIGR